MTKRINIYLREKKEICNYEALLKKKKKQRSSGIRQRTIIVYQFLIMINQITPFVD